MKSLICGRYVRPGKGDSSSVEKSQLPTGRDRQKASENARRGLCLGRAPPSLVTAHAILILFDAPFSS